MKKAILLCCVGVVACSRPVPKVQPSVHYVVGSGWQVENAWFYPREDFSYQATGLAVRQQQEKTASALTMDGEVRDDATMTGSHPTLQLPAVVTVMNLDNGREVTVRLNDRGPKEIGRLLGLSRKAADLLGMGTGPARVRIVEDEAASRHLAEILPGGPMLQINAAPLETVTQTQLKEAKAGARVGRAVPAVQQSAPQEAPVAGGPIVLSDLPATWRQGMPVAGQFWVETADFTSRYAAAREAARQGASVVPSFTQQGKMWAVRHGPFATISEADVALRHALADGLTGSHIVVE
ncbi:septal ring lytic transglycosylase RlpA family protein [Acetobacter senegalensis]|uniref:septal ring lytic transglycosylase RlpA family protein n=1 Tax=Acetobacter senegalensis TaxID=446692 RepID=UPI002657192D|nr:RlpA-like double-psi beta-barrel domain-containing protein [Acetobacter senegalensis]MDN7354172.1 RlpA-like double-psi beta-barrel domain-containing protein [Acetobacter senegalensis]